METQAIVDSMMPLRIRSVSDAAESIRSFELVQCDGSELPAFTPGAHVSVLAPNGAVRKYSLCNDANDRSRYVITVKRDARGRGGSLNLVDHAKAGDLLKTSAPENTFRLNGGASRYIFVAGGIGITPILSMVRSQKESSRVPWNLYYLTHSPERTAFLDELTMPDLHGRVFVHHNHGDEAKRFDLWPLLERPGGAAHIYCCGPRRLMDAVRDMSGHWPRGHVHFESFTEGGEVKPDDQPFTVKLRKSNRTFEIPVGKSILSVLREGGCQLASACESGTCGTCRTGLVQGDADHRDMVLLPEETSTQIMICVSRARSGEIVLDL